MLTFISVKIIAAIFNFYSSGKVRRETYLYQEDSKRGNGAMNITALINRKTATKRNETKSNLDVVVSSSTNQTP